MPDITRGMQIGQQTLEDFSAALLDLGALPPSASPSQLMRQGLGALATLVPHDSAWRGPDHAAACAQDRKGGRQKSGRRSNAFTRRGSLPEKWD